MKLLAASVLCMFAGTAQAAQLPWWAPSPVSIAVTVGSWIMTEPDPVFQVRVQAQAATESEARREAFRKATELAIGSLVTSQTRVTGDHVTQHEIVSYSSGRVERFQEVAKTYSSGQTRLTLDVWVRRSTIADRLMTIPGGSADIPGEQLAAQHDSVQAERRDGDRMLEMVLTDYPRQAYEIAVINTRAGLDSRRRLRVDVEFEIGMNTRYLAALEQAARATSQLRDQEWCLRNRCGSGHLVSVQYHRSGDFFRSGSAVKFDDQHRGRLFEHYLRMPNPHIKMVIHDGHGTAISAQCWAQAELTYTNYHPARRFVHWDESRTIIDGNLRVRSRLSAEIPGDQISDIRKVELQVVSADQCST